MPYLHALSITNAGAENHRSNLKTEKCTDFSLYCDYRRSYGAGQGDWFIEKKYNPNSRYQATHVIQDLTKRDVISLSRAGAGSYDGSAIYAINTWRYLNHAGFISSLMSVVYSMKE